VLSHVGKPGRPRLARHWLSGQGKRLRSLAIRRDLPVPDAGTSARASGHRPPRAIRPRRGAPPAYPKRSSCGLPAALGSQWTVCSIGCWRVVTEILPGIPGRASERGTPPSSGCCIVAMFTLAITVWLTANPAAPPHIVYSSPTPWSVCAGMADKLNIPLLFPREISMRADCLPYQPPQN
jgi:hypothetical protein